MTEDVVTQAANPGHDVTVSREMLARMDEAAESGQHWKIFSEFGPNTTTFVYPAEIFPVRVRTTCHGIAAAAGKIGAFISTYALAALLPDIGLGKTSGIVAGVSLLGLLVTVTLLPEPKGKSLEDVTEQPYPTSAVPLGILESRGSRPPAA